MAWKIEWDDRALRELKKLDITAQRRIFRYLEEQVLPSSNPRKLGKSLGGPKAGLWRYRVGDYRIVAKIEDKKLIVLILRVGHRKNVYD